MSFAGVIIVGLRTASVATFLGLGTMFLLFLERKIWARAQHRPGPNRTGSFGEWQISADILKVFHKWRTGKQEKLFAHGWSTLPAQLSLPVVFMAILLGAWHLNAGAGMELLLLFLLIVFAVVLEAFFLQGSGFSTIEKYEYRRYIAVNLIGVCACLLSLGTVVLHTGSLALHSIVLLQLRFPFHSLFVSPGLFIAAVSAFLSFFFILAVSPVGEMGDRGVLGSRQYLYFLYKRMWIFTLASFWVYLFGGAIGGILDLPLYSLRIVIFLFSLVLLQASMPKLRAGDALEVGVRFLLPMSLCGLLLEIFWVGWWAK